MAVAVSTSHLHAEGSLVENTSAEMSPVARQANVGKLGDRKPDNSLETLFWCPNRRGLVDGNRRFSTPTKSSSSKADTLNI